MTKKKKALAILIGSALFTSAARFSYSHLRFMQVESRFHSIRPGMPRQKVLDVLGEPNYHNGTCGKIGVAPKGCVREFVYSDPLAPVVPDFYVVSFSKDERVISAEPWRSP